MSANTTFLSVRIHERLVLASNAARLVHALVVHLVYHGHNPVVVTGRLLHEIARDGGIKLSRSAAVKGLNELENLGMIEREKIGHAYEIRLPNG